MSEKITTKLGTPVQSLAHVTSLARDFVVTRKRVFRNTERILRQDQATKTALDQSGGLQELLSNNDDPDAERSFLSSFSNLQQTLFVDRVTDSDLSTTPRLGEMFESSKNNGKALVKIATDLADCCATIQRKIDELSDLVRSSFNNLLKTLSDDFDQLDKGLVDNFTILNKNLDILYDRLIAFYNAEKHAFSLGLQRDRDILEDYLSTLYQSQKKNIEKVSVDVRNSTRETLVNVKDYVNRARDQVINDVTNHFNGVIDRIIVLIRELQASTDALVGRLIVEFITPILAGTNEALLAIGASLIEINTLLGDLLLSLRDLPSTIDSHIDRLAEKYKKQLEDAKDDIIRQIAEEVSLSKVYKTRHTSTLSNHTKMEISGLEPLTSALQGQRSTN